MLEMRAYVIDLVERNELGVGDLVRRPPCLVDEVEVPGPNPDQAPDPPRPKVPGDRAFGHHRVRRRRNRRGVVIEPVGSLLVRDPDAGERLQRLHEGLQTALVP